MQILKSLKKLAAGALLVGGITTAANAQFSQFAQYTHLTNTVNSPVLQSTPFQVFVPPLSLTVNASNNPTIITNTINQVLQFTNSTTFIYNAALYGTNFSTNWPGYWVWVTNNTYGQAVPQIPNTNNCDIK